MIFSIKKDVFYEALSLASHFTSNKVISSTILQGVYLKIKEDSIDLFASNLSSFFHTKISLSKKTKEEVDVVTEPRKIIEFINLLPEGEINIEIKDRQIIISSAENKGGFLLMDKKDFPLPPKIEDKEQKIGTKDFKSAISLVSFCAASDEARPALTGIDFIPGEETLVLATDGFRLSLVRINKKIKIPKSIIPAEFLSEIIRHINDEKEISFSYSETEKIILFKIGEKDFYSRLIEGEAPSYEKVIPLERKTKIRINKEELLRNVKIISVFARDLSNIVVLEIKKGEIVIRPKAEKTDEAMSKIESITEGDDQRIAFNYKFLLDLLSHIEAKNIEIDILRPDAPVVFRIEGREDFLHVIMPVRIQE